MLLYIKKYRPSITVDAEKNTINGYKLEYYKAQKDVERIRIKELKIDLSEYLYN
jgi:hypothetical protein